MHNPACTVVLPATPPTYLLDLLQLPSSASVQNCHRLLASLLTSPSSRFVISLPIDFSQGSKAIFGTPDPLPLYGSIIHADFLLDIISISLHNSTKNGLVAAYQHFLESWPMRYVNEDVRLALLERFKRGIVMMGWEVGCESLKAMNDLGKGSGDFTELCKNIQQAQCDASISPKPTKKQTKSPKILSITKETERELKLPRRLKEMVDDAMENIKALFVPALEEPRSIWVIPYQVPKAHRKSFVLPQIPASNDTTAPHDMNGNPPCLYERRKKKQKQRITSAAAKSSIPNSLPPFNLSLASRNKRKPIPKSGASIQKLNYYRPANIAESSTGGKIRLSSFLPTSKFPTSKLNERKKTTNRVPVNVRISLYPSPERSSDEGEYEKCFCQKESSCFFHPPHSSGVQFYHELSPNPLLSAKSLLLSLPVSPPVSPSAPSMGKDHAPTPINCAWELIDGNNVGERESSLQSQRGISGGKWAPGMCPNGVCNWYT
ncbi:hypothetical protein RUND412_008117 [Rhizina undulata]